MSARHALVALALALAASARADEPGSRIEPPPTAKIPAEKTTPAPTEDVLARPTLPPGDPCSWTPEDKAKHFDPRVKIAEFHVVPAENARLVDSEDRLGRFLGATPGAPWDQLRILCGLDRLGYWLTADPAIRQVSEWSVAVTVTVQPKQLVRHVIVHGNWPILRAVYNEDIVRRITLRPGMALPPTPKLIEQRLHDEEDRIRAYFRREGFFQGDVAVVLENGGDPNWVDVVAIVHLGPWYTLGHIAAEGVQAFTPEEIARPFEHAWPPSFWGRFRVDRVHEDARSAEQMYHQHDYPAARVFATFNADKSLTAKGIPYDLDDKHDKVQLHLNVVEKGKVQLVFTSPTGRALQFSDRDLRDKTTIFSAGSYDEAELAESAREIHRFYQTHGFLEAHVSFREVRSGDRHVITFIVDEGPELRVEDVQFVPEAGEDALTVPGGTSKIESLVATKPFPRLLGAIGLGGGGYVTDIQLAQDAEKIAGYYRSEGYVEAHVTGLIARSPEGLDSIGVLGANLAAEAGDDDRVWVRFVIHEGPRRIFDRVAVQMVGGGDPARVEQALDLHAGGPVAPDTVDAAVKRVIEMYQSTGHPYVVVKRHETWSADHTRLAFAIDVDEGPLVRYGEILIRGNFRTSTWVIRRDLPFNTGDVYDVRQLDRAVRNLRTHNIFASVRIGPSPSLDEAIAKRITPLPILIEVQELYDNWGQVEGAVGYATDLGATASLSYFWGNVWGGGGQLELRGDIAADIFGQPWTLDYNGPFYRLLSGTLRYSHPHLFWPNLRGEVSAFWRKENTPALGEVISYGARATMAWIESVRFRFYGRLDFSKSTLQNIDFDRLPGRNDGVTAIPDDTRIFKLTAGVLYDDRISFEGARNPLMPVAGWLFGVQGALSFAPLSEHNFFVASGQIERLQPLQASVAPGHGVTLITNVRADWGFPIGEPALPAVERFFAGGDADTRGYDTDKLRTEIVRGGVSPSPGAAGFRVIAQGGNVRLLGTVEVQFPIATIGDMPWVGAVFVDAGSIFDEARLFSPTQDIKYSVGVTLLRFLTPVGPLSLEYAYPLNDTLATELWKKESFLTHWPGRIHFNWGIPLLR